MRRRRTRLSVTYRRWDVVAVDYPFLEGADSKRRPAVVVSTEALREEAGVYWLMMITTAKAGVRRGDIAVSDAAKAGLPSNAAAATKVSLRFTSSSRLMILPIGCRGLLEVPGTSS